VPASLPEQILRAIDDAGDLYYRLVLLAAPAGGGKTAALLALAERPGFRYLNVNLELSRRLLELSARERSLAVPRLLGEIVAGDGHVALLDNIEILFDVSLKVDPLRLLQRLSRNRTVVAAWNGSVEGGYLTYAAPDHAEHRRYAARELLVLRPKAGSGL